MVKPAAREVIPCQVHREVLPAVDVERLWAPLQVLRTSLHHGLGRFPALFEHVVDSRRECHVIHATNIKLAGFRPDTATILLMRVVSVELALTKTSSVALSFKWPRLADVFCPFTTRGEFHVYSGRTSIKSCFNLQSSRLRSMSARLYIRYLCVVLLFSSPFKFSHVRATTSSGSSMKLHAVPMVTTCGLLQQIVPPTNFLLQALQE